MTLAITQHEDIKLKFRKWFWIWERDLLWLAKRYPAWRAKANELGFTNDKIESDWLHADAGRQIKYMENPFYENNDSKSK